MSNVDSGVWKVAVESLFGAEDLECALCKLRFRKRDAESAVVTLQREQAAPELEPLLRAALDMLTPARV